MFVPFIRTSADYYHPYLCYTSRYDQCDGNTNKTSCIARFICTFKYKPSRFISFFYHKHMSLNRSGNRKLILSIYHAPFTFLAQSMCYFIAVLLCLPLTFKTVGETNKANKGFSFTVVWEYFKNNMQASKIFITSLIIMATGFSYTALVPVLVHDLFLVARKSLVCQ